MIEKFIEDRLEYETFKAKIIWEERDILLTKKTLVRLANIKGYTILSRTSIKLFLQENISTELKSMLNKLLSVNEELKTSISVKQAFLVIKSLLKVVKELTKPVRKKLVKNVPV